MNRAARRFSGRRFSTRTSLRMAYKGRASMTTFLLGLACLAPLCAVAQGAKAESAKDDPYLELMRRAAAHSKAHHGKYMPVLSPVYQSVIGKTASVNVKALQAEGFLVIPWTADDEDSIRGLLAQHVDGIISDYPDMLAKVIAEERAKAAGNAAELAYLARMDAEGHRGGRGIRPENTLPAFEAGLDNGIHTIETDTGVTTDHQSLIWHDQFLNPQSCRRADGKPYTLENRVYTRDISMVDAQKTFICDKLHFGTEQKNDLALSPVAVAFAAKEHMPSPYAPTNAAQLFRFVNFYTEYYEKGAGKGSPFAAERAHTGRNVHFNLETKITPVSEAKMMSLATGRSLDEIKASGRLPEEAFAESHTVSPEIFVDTLCGFVKQYHMEARSDVQSFDFRTLLLVQEKFPDIRTVYLTQSPKLLSTEIVPEPLRVPKVR